MICLKMQHRGSGHEKLLSCTIFDTIHQFFADTKTIIAIFGGTELDFHVKSAELSSEEYISKLIKYKELSLNSRYQEIPSKRSKVRMPK